MAGDATAGAFVFVISSVSSVLKAAVVVHGKNQLLAFPTATILIACTCSADPEFTRNIIGADFRRLQIRVFWLFARDA